MPQSTTEVPVHRYGAQARADPCDLLAVEEPLEIRLEYGLAGARMCRSVAITMRTPGDDFALAVGFLFGEQIVRRPADIALVRYYGLPDGPQGLRNALQVSLRPGVAVTLERLERHFYTSSSCGVCGKTSIEALQLAACPSLPSDGPCLPAAVIHQLPARLRAAQAIFDSTGGLHAAALCDVSGAIECVREDIGRHNAVDKLIGTRLLAANMDFSSRLLLVSGRASFELTQKAVVAGIPILAAVGAPSSLAVELAAAHNLTLIGFVRNERFNVYTCPWRIVV